MADATLAPLLERLRTVERELECLDAALADYAATLHGNDFPEQETLASIMGNTCLSAAHETATSIGFARERIATLDLFIRFRRQFRLFSNDELRALIDGPPPSLHMKKDLLARFDTPQIFLQKVDQLRHEWNKTFQNRSYSKVKEFR